MKAGLAQSLFEVEAEGQSKAPLWSLKDYENELKNEESNRFLWKDSSQIKGFVLYRIVIDELSLMHLAVRKKGQGEGLELLRAFELFSNDSAARTWLLEVSLENLSAQKLYFKFGFVQIGLRKNYYKDGSDALVLQRKL